MTSGPIARDTAQTTAVLTLRLVVQAGTLFLLARMLGPAQFGQLASLVALAVFLGSLATFGAHLTLLRELARDPRHRERLLPVVLGTSTALGAVLLLIYLWACRYPMAYGGSLWPAAAIGTAELLLQPLLLVSSVERLAEGKAALSQLVKMTALPLQFLAAGALWISGTHNPFAFYAAAHLLAAVFALALVLLLARRGWPSPRKWRLLDRAGWKDSGGFAVLAMTASGPAELDKVVAARFLPLEQAGLYAAASRIAGAAVVPVSSLMISVLPRLFRESHNGITRRLLVSIFIGSLSYGLLISMLLWFVAPLVAVLFGSSFAGTQDVLRWLCLAIPALCLRLAGTNVLMTAGAPWTRALVEGAGIFLMAGLAIGLILGRVDQGMVIAVACAEALMAAASWFWIYRIQVDDRSGSARV